jgi:hypothetical protein
LVVVDNFSSDERLEEMVRLLSLIRQKTFDAKVTLKLVQIKDEGMLTRTASPVAPIPRTIDPRIALRIPPSFPK